MVGCWRAKTTDGKIIENLLIDDTELGFDYDNHPYELEAIAEESNWKKYAK